VQRRRIRLRARANYRPRNAARQVAIRTGRRPTPRAYGFGCDRWSPTGFRKSGQVRVQGKTQADQLRDLQDAYRARAPLEYADRIRGYIKGAAAGDDSGK